MQSNMLTHIRTESDLDAALAALTSADARFSALMASAGRPALRRRPDGFAGLAATVVSQQLSTASAAAIWGRLAAAFDPFEPQVIMRARAAKLARLGLSAPKIRALKAIARAVAARVLWTYYRVVKGREGAPVPTSARLIPKISPKPGRGKQDRNKESPGKRGRNGRRA